MLRTLSPVCLDKKEMFLSIQHGKIKSELSVSDNGEQAAKRIQYIRSITKLPIKRNWPTNILTDLYNHPSSESKTC